MATSTFSLLGARWQHIVLTLVLAGALALLLSQPFGQVSQPGFEQVSRLHTFADTRTLLGIGNAFDVLSNLAFLLVGLGGLRFCLRRRMGSMWHAWGVLFAGIALVSLGSAYYHMDPNNDTLVWDRLPMTIGFTGLFAALMGEYVSERFGAFILVPALLAGIGSVLYWRWFGDARFYYWIQLLPFLTIPAVMVLYRPRHSHQWLLPAALGWYAVAKISEANDRALFELSQGLVSGHTGKHLLAAMACLTLLWMLQTRKPVRA